VPRRWRTSGTSTPDSLACSRPSRRRILRAASVRRPRTAASGAVPRWRSGSESSSAETWPMHAAGRSSSGWAGGPCVRAGVMRVPIRRRRLGFKETLPQRLRAEEEAHPDAEVELWAMDEHRLGLKPVLRRVWTPPGEAPIAVVDPGYEWLYVAAFVHPESGTSSFWLLSGVSGPVFDLLLKAFAEEQGVGRRKRILLVLDQAGWHGSSEVELFPGLTLIFLPAYSPELQPAERLWPLVDEP